MAAQTIYEEPRGEQKFNIKEDSSVWKIENKALQIFLHAGQKRAWLSEREIVAVIAGAQSGKTTFGPLWMFREIQRCGPGEYGVVCPTFPLMDKKCLPEFKRLFQTALKFGTYVKSDKKFYFNDYGLMKMFGTKKHPCSVIFGYAADPDSLESATFKAVWCDEAGQSAFKLGSFDAIQRRLSIHDGRMLITTTPYDLGWLKTKIWDSWKRGDPNIDVINFRSIDNPSFSKERYYKMRDRMPPWKFDLFYNGIFSSPNGQIYDVFKSEVHMVRPFQIPESWPRVWGLDFGQANMACLKIAVNPGYVEGSDHPHERRLYVYQTYRPSEAKSVDEHVASLKNLDRCAGKAMCFGGAASEDSWRTKFWESGLQIYQPSVTGPDSVEVGIDAVYEAFATGQLAFFSNLTELENEVKTYQWEIDNDDEIIPGKIVNKNTFHRLDALRYAVSEIISNPSILMKREIISTWSNNA